MKQTYNVNTPDDTMKTMFTATLLILQKEGYKVEDAEKILSEITSMSIALITHGAIVENPDALNVVPIRTA